MITFQIFEENKLLESVLLEFVEISFNDILSFYFLTIEMGLSALPSGGHHTLPAPLTVKPIHR